MAWKDVFPPCKNKTRIGIKHSTSSSLYALKIYAKMCDLGSVVLVFAKRQYGRGMKNILKKVKLTLLLRYNDTIVSK